MLYQRQANDLEKRQKQAAVARQLTEAALMFADHSTTGSLQRIDFKEIFRKKALIALEKINADEPKNHLFEISDKRFFKKFWVLLSGRRRKEKKFVKITYLKVSH